MYDIPKIPDLNERIAEVTVDCYGQAEELTAFEVYLTDAVQYPFRADWRDPDEPGHHEIITVLGIAKVDERRGILLQVQRGDKERRILAEQIYAADETNSNAIVLNDYRHWIEKMNGLTPGYG